MGGGEGVLKEVSLLQSETNFLRLYFIFKESFAVDDQFMTHVVGGAGGGGIGSVGGVPG